MNLRKSVIWLIALLVLTALACSQAGEILTPEEATARALPTATPTLTADESATTYAIGDVVTIKDPGGGFLVLFVAEPGTSTVSGQAPRGDQVEIIEVTLVNGVEWYQIQSPGGVGWISLDHINTDG
ncbi:MAG: SH3 domain-containing protein [Anaerolineae bacterium]|nr:SH3 domain-containing protein [Anaerolineae bacterium]